MIQKSQIKNKSEMVNVPSKMIQAIFEELRLLRNEVMLLFPQEDLEDYVNPERIKRSYQNAIKEYPPSQRCLQINQIPKLQTLTRP